MEYRKGCELMRRFFCILLAALLLTSACALADLKRGDSGDDVIWLQQMLWETGFIFEEPDGSFGKNTENAVKWFQEYAGLEQTGTADDQTMGALLEAWAQVMEEYGADLSIPDDEMEPQTAGFVSDEPAEGDYPVCCQCYTTAEGDAHIEPCGRHAALADKPADAWADELNALYDAWLAAAPEADRAAIASAQALFTLWLDQQTATLKSQGDDQADARIEALLRDQCADLCRAIYELQAE